MLYSPRVASWLRVLQELALKARCGEENVVILLQDRQLPLLYAEERRKSINWIVPPVVALRSTEEERTGANL